MFVVQLSTTILSAVLNVFVAKGIYEPFGKICDNDTGCLWKLKVEPPLGWSATGYNWTLIGFAIGLVLPFIPLLLHKQFPNSYWHLVNVPLIVVFPGLGGGSNRSETPLLVGIVVNYFIKMHRHAWWKTYAYVMSAALDAGLAITLTIIFLVFQFGLGAKTESEANRPMAYWALNRYDGEQCAPDWFLKCSENANWGKAWGKEGYFQTQSVDPYCTSINFQGGIEDAIVAAIDAGVIPNITAAI
ncbi:hypothetical protein HDU96_008483 [Phlyctochytrium bullatum]|nr:hypothetical protein HDU96_008483 [Phlyctochytrium bullatum]